MSNTWGHCTSNTWGHCTSNTWGHCVSNTWGHCVSNTCAELGDERASKGLSQSTARPKAAQTVPWPCGCTQCAPAGARSWVTSQKQALVTKRSACPKAVHVLTWPCGQLDCKHDAHTRSLLRGCMHVRLVHMDTRGIAQWTQGTPCSYVLNFRCEIISSSWLGKPKDL
eukprot:10209-Pelagomonas_calceolata.AAC.1